MSNYKEIINNFNKLYAVPFSEININEKLKHYLMSEYSLSKNKLYKVNNKELLDLFPMATLDRLKDVFDFNNISLMYSKDITIYLMGFLFIVVEGEDKTFIKFLHDDVCIHTTKKGPIFKSLLRYHKLITSILNGEIGVINPKLQELYLASLYLKDSVLDKTLMDYVSSDKELSQANYRFSNIKIHSFNEDRFDDLYNKNILKYQFGNTVIKFLNNLYYLKNLKRPYKPHKYVEYDGKHENIVNCANDTNIEYCVDFKYNEIVYRLCYGTESYKMYDLNNGIRLMLAVHGNVTRGNNKHILSILKSNGLI